MDKDFSTFNNSLSKKEIRHAMVKWTILTYRESKLKSFLLRKNILKISNMFYFIFLNKKIKKITNKFLTAFMDIPSPKDYPFGVSAIIIAKNEEEWIGQSLLLISKIADELIIIDNGSTDSTVDIINSFMDNNPDLNIDFKIEKSNQFFTHRNKQYSKAKYRYIFRWDADFIVHDEGVGSILWSRDYLRGLDQTEHYSIRFPVIHFVGDVKHQVKGMESGYGDYYLHTNSPYLRVWRKGAWAIEYKAPYYQHKDIEEMKIFHPFGVKSKYRLLYRHYWVRWGVEADKKKFPSVESYILSRLEKDWGTTNIEEACNEYMKRGWQNLVPYDEEQFGPLPKAFRDELKNPRFIVVMEDGEFKERLEPKKSSPFN